MSIRYTLRHNIPAEKLAAEDVNDSSTWDFNLLRKHELAETNDHDVVYRQHDGKVVSWASEEDVDETIKEECRPEDGNYVLHDNKTAQNLSALDAQVKDNEDAIGSVGSDGNYIKDSDTKNVCENLEILDAQVKTNADNIKTNADNIATKAPINSPALTGVPTAPTAQAGTNTTQVATTEFVQGEISGLVSSAPEALDTLKELADALGDDPNFATTVSTALGNKVDKTSENYIKSASVSGKTLTLTKGNDSTVTFTEVDTQYTNGNGLNLSSGEFSAKAGTNITVDSSGINAPANGLVASADTGLLGGGTAYTELRPTRNGTWVKTAQTTAVNLEKLDGGIEYAYAILSRQYDQLKKYINGNYYEYDIDSTSAYTKSVPSGAMPYAGLESLGGKTVVWNQLIGDPHMTDVDNWIVSPGAETFNKTITNNVLRFERSTTSLYNVSISCTTRGSAVVGHKYLCVATVASDIGQFRFYMGDSFEYINTTTTLTKCSAIITATTTAKPAIYIVGASFTQGKYIEISNYCIFDLTLMFGSGNEPSTVAEFEAMFPADYYPYNAGQLLSAGVTEVASQGVNLLDGVTMVVGSIDTANGANVESSTRVRTDYVPIQENEVYDLSVNNNLEIFFVFFYTSAKSYISSVRVENANTTVTTPATASYVRVLYRFADNSTITLADVTKTTLSLNEYSNTYPIPTTIRNLEGYGWSAGTAYNYVDFERKVFVQNVGKSVITNESNILVDGSVGSFYRYYINKNNLKRNQAVTEKSYAQMMVSDYGIVRYGHNIDGDSVGVSGYNAGMSANPGRNWLYMFATQSTVADFKTYLADHPITVYYELETPVETDISAYLTDDNLIEVEDNGTLTFPNANGDDYRIPVPSEEEYMIDLQSAIGG